MTVKTSELRFNSASRRGSVNIFSSVRRSAVRRAVAVCFVAMFFLLGLPLPICAYADAEVSAYTLSPYVGRGVSINWEKSDSSILGVMDGNTFTPAETKTLTLYARFSRGYSYCPQYSFFFDDDPSAIVQPTNDLGDFSFSYTFTENLAVLKSDFEGLRILASADLLPKLMIATDIPTDSITKDNWESASISLELGSKVFACGKYNGRVSIKGRGNSSWRSPKKSYSINLKSAASLLDIPATEKYAIVAAYDDSSMLRNYITYKTGQSLSSIEYTPKCEFIDVYMNGIYCGVYLLVERVDIEESKVNIKCATRFNIDGGYLIEKNLLPKVNIQTENWFDSPYRANISEDVFSVVAPDPENDTFCDEMLLYLETYLFEAHKAIITTSDDSYLDYVDVDTWVDFLIMQEISKNIDGNLKTSCYMYKLDGSDKLYMTALWDFDLAYGNCDYSNASMYNDCYDCPLGSTTTGFMVINSSCPWFDTLYHDHADFYLAVKQRYAEYRGTLIPNMFNMIYEQAAYISTSAKYNDMIWGSDSVTATQALYTWLEQRISWLDEQWLNNPSLMPETKTDIPLYTVIYALIVNAYNVMLIVTICRYEMHRRKTSCNITGSAKCLRTSPRCGNGKSAFKSSG